MRQGTNLKNILTFGVLSFRENLFRIIVVELYTKESDTENNLLIHFFTKIIIK